MSGALLERHGDRLDFRLRPGVAVAQQARKFAGEDAWLRVEQVVAAPDQRLEAAGGGDPRRFGRVLLQGQREQFIGDAAGGALFELVEAARLEPLAQADRRRLERRERPDGAAQGGEIIGLGCVGQASCSAKKASVRESASLAAASSRRWPSSDAKPWSTPG